MLSYDKTYAHYADRFNSQAGFLSVLMHSALFIIVILSAWIRPYTPPEINIEQVEVIDVETFEQLLEEVPGSDGEDDIDVSAVAPAAPEKNEAEVVTSQDVKINENQEAQPSETIEPELQTEALPEPIFQPDQLLETQPLPQNEVIEETGLAEPESTGQENTVETSTVEVPPSRNAEDIRQIAQDLEGEIAEAPQEELVEAETQSVSQEENAQSQVLPDAANEIVEEAVEDTPLSGAPQVTEEETIVENTIPEPEAEPVEEIEALNLEEAVAIAVQSQEAEAPPIVEPEAEPVEEIIEIEPPSEVEVETPDNGTAEIDPIADLINSAIAEEQSVARGGRGLTNSERAAILRRFNDRFTSIILTERGAYRPQPIRVSFRTTASGTLYGEVKLIEPKNPNQDQFRTFSAARRAIIFSMPIPMPADIDPEGLIWQVTFDPSPSGGVF